MKSGNLLTLRRLVKTGVASALYRTGADNLIGQFYGSRQMPLVLCYHRVVEDYETQVKTAIPGLLISPRIFEHHLDWLASRYRIVSLDELGSRLETGDGFGKPIVAITFDDGYRDFYDHAFPILKRKGVPAAVFPVIGLAGTSKVPFYNRLYLLLSRAFSEWQAAREELAGLFSALDLPDPLLPANGSANPAFDSMCRILDILSQSDILSLIAALETRIPIEEELLKNLRLLDWEMLSEIQRSGITVGSHAQTHALLTKESFQKVLDETLLSRQALERRLGTRVQHFAYPCGRFNPLVASAVAAAGYRFAYTTCFHRDPVYPLLTIPRLVLWQNSCLDALGRFSSPVMSCQVNQVFGWLDCCRQDHRRPWPPPLDTGPRAEAAS